VGDQGPIKVAKLAGLPSSTSVLEAGKTGDRWKKQKEEKRK
jgi:hypothetical protein